MIRVFASTLLFMAIAFAEASEVNVYAARKEALIKPLFERFTEKTGVKVNLLTGKADALIKRLELEGDQSVADMLLTVDAGRLYRAKEKGLLQAITSERLDQAIAKNYRDPEGYWYGISLRARVIVYSRANIKPAMLSTYEDLADPRWEKQICVRSSANIYNQSLVSAMIAHHGEAKTGRWVSALVNNFARAPKGGDRDQIKAVSVGQCNLALVNTYYLAGMLASNIKSEAAAASKVALFWPNNNQRGVHVNISGAGISRVAKNRAAAIALLEYLVSEPAQRWYAEINHEFPVLANVPGSDTLQSWGVLKADDLSLEMLGKHNQTAVKIMDKAGWK